MLLAISATFDCDGLVLASLSRSKWSALIMPSLRDLITTSRFVRTSSVNFLRVWLFQKVTLTNKKWRFDTGKGQSVEDLLPSVCCLLE